MLYGDDNLLFDMKIGLTNLSTNIINSRRIQVYSLYYNRRPKNVGEKSVRASLIGYLYELLNSHLGNETKKPLQHSPSKILDH